jgi:hypothetical protein
VHLQVAVPEPASLTLGGIGAILLLVRRQRRHPLTHI